MDDTLKRMAEDLRSQELQQPGFVGSLVSYLRKLVMADVATYGWEHQEVANKLHDLARVLQATEQLVDAEQIMRQMLVIRAKLSDRRVGEDPALQDGIEKYRSLVIQCGMTREQAQERIRSAMTEGGQVFE